jgi:hypothetical protein
MIAFSLVLKGLAYTGVTPVTNFDKITIAAAADASFICMQRTLRFRILSQC